MLLYSALGCGGLVVYDMSCSRGPCRSGVEKEEGEKIVAVHISKPIQYIAVL